MAESSIEWTDATWNPVSGCTRASPGCDNCYAVPMTYRLEKMGQKKYAGLTVLNGKGDRHFNGQVRTHEDALAIPLGWKKPRQIFVNSMSDLFHKDVPFEFIRSVFGVMSQTTRHTYQILTKRSDIASVVIPEIFNGPKPHHEWDQTWWHRRERNGFLPNVWIGASVENQEQWNRRSPHLDRVPAAVRFLSCEPLLGPLEFSDVSRRSDGIRQLGKPALDGIDWVIVGGESGPGARPFNIEWARSIIQQCKAAGVACFVKQVGSKPYEDARSAYAVRSWNDARIQLNGEFVQIHLKDKKGGDIAEWPEDLRVREFPKGRVPA